MATTATLLQDPVAIAAGPDGYLYVLEAHANPLLGGHLVHKLRPTGEIVASWGTQGSATGWPPQHGGTAQFGPWPNDLAVDPHNRIYVADPNQYRLVVFEPDGRLHGSVSTEVIPGGMAMRVDVDSSSRIYVSGSLVGIVQRIIPTGQAVRQWSPLSGHLSLYALTVDRQRMVGVSVGFGSELSLVELVPGGTLVPRWSWIAQGVEVMDIAADSCGRLYLADRAYGGPGRIWVLGADGTLLDQWDAGTVDNPLLERPMRLAVDGEDLLYVADHVEYECSVSCCHLGYVPITYKHSPVILKLDPRGRLVAVWGDPMRPPDHYA